MRLKIKYIYGVAAIFLFCITLYSLVYMQVKRSDAYGFAESMVFRSALIEKRVGKVQSVDLEVLGPMEYESVGDETTLKARLIVKGTEKSLHIDVQVKRTGNTWSIERVYDGESNIAL